MKKCASMVKIRLRLQIVRVPPWKSLENRKVFRFLPFDLVDNVAGMIHSRRSMFLHEEEGKRKEDEYDFTRLQIFSLLFSFLNS